MIVEFNLTRAHVFIETGVKQALPIINNGKFYVYYTRSKISIL